MRREEYYFDPNKLPAGERAYYKRIKAIIDGLLDDLRNAGCFRRADIEETQNFISLMKDKDEMGLAFNRIIEVFETPQKISDFIEQNKTYFPDDNSFSYLFMSQLYFLSLVHMEMFKNFLLFYLKRGSGYKFRNKMTLSPFFSRLKEISPVHGELIEKEFDIDLRNSFAHGLFHIDVKTGTLPDFNYYNDLGNLRKPVSISLVKLMKKRKNYNIVYITLAYAIAERMDRKTFR